MTSHQLEDHGSAKEENCSDECMEKLTQYTNSIKTAIEKRFVIYVWQDWSYIKVTLSWNVSYIVHTERNFSISKYEIVSVKVTNAATSSTPSAICKLNEFVNSTKYKSLIISLVCPVLKPSTQWTVYIKFFNKVWFFPIFPVSNFLFININKLYGVFKLPSIWNYN